MMAFLSQAVPLVRRWWPVVASLLALFLSWWQVHAALQRAHARGVAEERLRWEGAAITLQTRQQAAVDTAGAEAASRIAAAQSVESQYVEKVHILYRDRPDPECVDAAGMRLIAEADRQRAAPAGGGAAGMREAGTG